MNQQDYNYTIIQHGAMITNLMKTDIVEIYFNSRTHARAVEQAKYIKDKLCRTYGNCWCVHISDLDHSLKHSFLCPDELLFEFSSDSQHVLIYLIEAYLNPNHNDFPQECRNSQMNTRYKNRITEQNCRYPPNFEHVYRPYTSHYRVAEDYFY